MSVSIRKADKEEIFARLSVVNGHLERCPECKTPLFAPFLKKKFGEIQVDGQYECIVCIRRELLDLKRAQKAD